MFKKILQKMFIGITTLGLCAISNADTAGSMHSEDYIIYNPIPLLVTPCVVKDNNMVCQLENNQHRYDFKLDESLTKQYLIAETFEEKSDIPTIKKDLQYLLVNNINYFRLFYQDDDIRQTLQHIDEVSNLQSIEVNPSIKNPKTLIDNLQKGEKVDYDIVIKMLNQDPSEKRTNDNTYHLSLIQMENKTVLFNRYGNLSNYRNWIKTYIGQDTYKELYPAISKYFKSFDLDDLKDTKAIKSENLMSKSISSVLVFIASLLFWKIVWDMIFSPYKNEKNIKSPSLSKIEDLIEKVESLKHDIKTASCEFDKSNLELYESALIKFNLLKKQVYEEYKKINWKKNKSEKILESYQQIIDGYGKEMKKEYKKMLKQFDAQMANYVKDRLDKIDIIKNL
jgi:hypothetical protein